MTSRSILSTMVRRQQVLVCRKTSGTLPPGFQHGGPRSFHGTSIVCDDKNYDQEEDKRSNVKASLSWKIPEMRTLRMHHLPYTKFVVGQQQQSPLLTSLLTWNHNCQLQQLQQFQHLRWKHGAAQFGKTREKLDEIAHRPEREAAQAKRQKNKEKKVARKTKMGKEDEEEGDDLDYLPDNRAAFCILK